MITIGMPVYNGEKFIKTAIKSVLNQSYSDFELIITDDGSTDKTVEIIKSFNDPRIKLIADGENHGISYRLNQQINLANGEYFVRMDADDIMFPQRIETQLKCMQENPKVDVVGSSAVIIGDANEILGQRRYGNQYNSINSTFYQTRFIHPTVIGKTSWFRKYQYRDDVKGCEDYDLWIRSFNESNFFEIEQPLLFYRDPYKFKIRTYLFRKKQLRKMLKNNKHLIEGNTVYYVFLLKIYFTTILSVILHYIGLDKIMLKKRNQNIDSSIYQDILDKLTK